MLNVGLIGCGNISETYFRSQTYFNNINITTCADINSESSKKCAAEYNIINKSVDDLLADPAIDVVLNLTTPQAHYETIKKTLLAGKHSYCEKPLSTNYNHGAELVQIAKEKNLYIGNAPDTFLGGGVQLAREFIDNGEIGQILTGNFIFAFPGMQTCHPDPESWFTQGGGPVIDMGPYFFTTLVNLLGPAKNVRSRGLKFFNNRIYEIGPKKGQQFNVEIPTSYMFDLEFYNNAVVQGFLSFDVNNHGRNHMELYGTKGSIIVPDPNMFGGPVSVSQELGSEWIHHSVENKLLGKTNIFSQSSRSNEAPQQSNYRGVGLAEMLNAIENQKLHRCNGELALHVLDMIDLTMKAAQSGDKKNMRTTCGRPEIFLEDEIKKLMK